MLLRNLICSQVFVIIGLIASIRLIYSIYKTPFAEHAFQLF